MPVDQGAVLLEQAHEAFAVEDYSTAIGLYRKSADDHMNMDAFACLGAAYYRGYGVDADIKESIRRYRIAISNGKPQYQDSLNQILAIKSISNHSTRTTTGGRSPYRLHGEGEGNNTVEPQFISQTAFQNQMRLQNSRTQ